MGTLLVTPSTSKKSIDQYDMIKNKTRVSKSKVYEALAKLKNDAIGFYADASITEELSYEELISLEHLGIICSIFTPDRPFGSYAGNYFKKSPLLHHDFEKIQPARDAIFRFVKPFGDSFSIRTHKEKEIHWKWDEVPVFENTFTTAQGIAFCTMDKSGTYEWNSPIIVPDGYHVQPPTCTAEQYAQSCFEGMIGMTDDQGALIVLRASDNAKRFRSSCISLHIPPISEGMFLLTLESTLKANKTFWPQEGTDKKLYIRPYIKGLEGGDAIRSAKSFVFVIQVFPINLPVNKATQFNIIGMEGKRRSHEGGLGMVKASSNYAQTILDRESAKKGTISYESNKKFDGVFYLSKVRTDKGTKEILDEMASGNLIFIKNKINTPQIITPSLQRKTILPGTVRDTILALSKFNGYEVVEKNLDFNEIKRMDFGFISGSALGLIGLADMTYKGKSIHFSKKKNYKQAKKVFESLYIQFMNLRKGEVSNDDWSDIKKWINQYV